MMVDYFSIEDSITLRKFSLSLAQVERFFFIPTPQPPLMKSKMNRGGRFGGKNPR